MADDSSITSKVDHKTGHGTLLQLSIKPFHRDFSHVFFALNARPLVSCVETKLGFKSPTNV